MEETVETKVPSLDQTATQKSPVVRKKGTFSLAGLFGIFSHKEEEKGNKPPIDLKQNKSPFAGVFPEEWLKGDYQKKE